MEHKWVESKNGVVHYWVNEKVEPQKVCLVFTHGLTADHTMFEQQTAFFEQDYNVITWDVPLHGLSQPYVDFSYENTAKELKSILDHESVEQAILVGMSMGGYPCQELISLYPDMVQGFIALDTTPFGTDYYSKSDLWWLKQAAPMANWFPDGMLRKSMAKSVSKTSYSYQKMMDMLAPQTKTQIVAQMDAAYGVFAKENKDLQMKCPVLLLVGEDDTTGKVKRYNEMWSEKTGYPLHIIQKAAHFSNGDNPEQVNHEIQLFLQQFHS
jgi:pimeloyl-ACP methyl ester carboxylesterase